MTRTIERPLPLTERERVARLVAAQVEERLAAYRSGYDAGYADGLEAGLRQLLADAELALGRAA